MSTTTYFLPKRHRLLLNQSLSPLRKQAIFTKRVDLDEIFIFRDSVMPEYQLIEKNENIAKRSFFDFVCFRSGLIIQSSTACNQYDQYHTAKVKYCNC